MNELAHDLNSVVALTMGNIEYEYIMTLNLIEMVRKSIRLYCSHVNQGTVGKF